MRAWEKGAGGKIKRPGATTASSTTSKATKTAGANAAPAADLRGEVPTRGGRSAAATAEDSLRARFLQPRRVPLPPTERPLSRSLTSASSAARSSEPRSST